MMPKYRALRNPRLIFPQLLCIINTNLLMTVINVRVKKSSTEIDQILRTP